MYQFIICSNIYYIIKNMVVFFLTFQKKKKERVYER